MEAGSCFGNGHIIICSLPTNYSIYNEKIFFAISVSGGSNLQLHNNMLPVTKGLIQFPMCSAEVMEKNRVIMMKGYNIIKYNKTTIIKPR